MPNSSNSLLKVIKLAGEITLGDFATKLKISSTEIIKKLFLKGQMLTINSTLPMEIAEEIAEEYSDKLKVIKLNIDQNQDTPLKFGVMNIPTLILFRDGKEIGRVIGAFPKKQLVNRIEPHLT